MPERISPSDPEWWSEYGWEHIQRYNFCASYCNGASVLDYGCGVGYGADVLAGLGAKSVVGFDRDTGVIAQAKARAQRRNLRFVDSADDLQGNQLFDLVTAFEVIEHVESPSSAIAQFAALLKPAGLLIISAPNKLQYTAAPEPIENEFHINEPTYEMLIEWLSPHFEVIREFEQSALPFMPYERDWHEYRRSLLLRAERALRRRLSRGVTYPRPLGDLLRRTELFPLIRERRATCHQFVFVARRNG